jgi:hypothetical protein
MSLFPVETECYGAVSHRMLRVNVGYVGQRPYSAEKTIAAPFFTKGAAIHSVVSEGGLEPP